jgi:hypothetical protein
MVGNFAQEEKFSSPCNGLFALEGISFSTGSLRIREVSGMGSATARRTTALRLILLAGGLFPTAKLHCLLLATFLTLARFIESSKSAACQSRSFSTT